MKTIVVVLLLAVMAVLARAGEADVAVAEFYKAGEFSVDTFGTVRTRDFDQERSGLGLGLNYFITRQFGFGLEGSAENTSGAFVDSTRVNLIFRIPMGRTAPYLFAGGGLNFDGGETETTTRTTPTDPGWPPKTMAVKKRGDDDAWGICFGAGVEHRLRERVGVFADARLDKVDDRAAQAIARLGLRINF